jgi:hypothetical protein
MPTTVTALGSFAECLKDGFGLMFASSHALVAYVEKCTKRV